MTNNTTQNKASNTISKTTNTHNTTTKKVTRQSYTLETTHRDDQRLNTNNPNA